MSSITQNEMEEGLLKDLLGLSDSPIIGEAIEFFFPTHTASGMFLQVDEGTHTLIIDTTATQYVCQDFNPKTLKLIGLPYHTYTGYKVQYELNIYKVSSPSGGSYDTYDSFVCIAHSSSAARKLHPYLIEEPLSTWEDRTSWVALDEIDSLEVSFVGIATEGKTEVLLASFNAG